MDINVLLDVLAQRAPFAVDAARVWSVSEAGQVRGIVCANSFSTIYYLMRRAANPTTALEALGLIRDAFDIGVVDSHIIGQAIGAPLGDFEDAVQYHSAVRAGADCIVTRDERGFLGAKIPVLAPDAFLASL